MKGKRHGGRVPPQERAPVGEVVRKPDGTFAPGAGSANPGGQPAWVKAIRNALQGTADKAVKLLDDCIEGRPTVGFVDGEEVTLTPHMPDRIRAAEIVLRYTVPVPKSEVEVTGKNGGPVEVSPSDAVARLAAALVKRVDAEAGRLDDASE